jgi:hypothetical protein
MLFKHDSYFTAIQLEEKNHIDTHTTELGMAQGG